MPESDFWSDINYISWLTRLVALGYTLLVLSIAVRVVIHRREIGTSLAWIALIMGLPLAGVILYGLFGELKLGRRRAEQTRVMFRFYRRWFKLRYHLQHVKASPLSIPIAELVYRRMGMPCLEGNQVQLLNHYSQILSCLIEDIHQARCEVLMEFYIWENGGQVDDINQALVDACQRGVACRIMVDSVGGRSFFRSEWAQRLRQAGVELVEVLPVGTMRMLFQRQDLRMHRKLVVIDRQIGYTGSMNLVDPRYFKQGIGIGEWVDIMVRLNGPVVDSMWATLAWDWEQETNERFLREPLIQYNSEAKDHFSRVQMIPSGPQFSDDIITQILLHSIYNAQHSICLTTPYFVPEESLAAALKAAAGRGIVVEVILPQRTDSLMVKYACSAFIEELVRAGVVIYLFKEGLLHAKSVLIDEQMALIGSVNLDRRSFWLNFEATVMIDDPEVARRIDAVQQVYRDQSHRLTLNRWRKRPWHQRLLENVFYLFSPLL